MVIDYKIIGERIKMVRKDNNMTQEVLAEKADVTVGYISQIKRGICKVNLDTLAIIANILNCEVSFLIDGTSHLNSSYLKNEITEKIMLCSDKQKKLILEFIDLLLEYDK